LVKYHDLYLGFRLGLGIGLIYTVKRPWRQDTFYVKLL